MIEYSLSGVWWMALGYKHALFLLFCVLSVDVAIKNLKYRAWKREIMYAIISCSKYPLSTTNRKC